MRKYLFVILAILVTLFFVVTSFGESAALKGNYTSYITMSTRSTTNQDTMTTAGDTLEMWNNISAVAGELYLLTWDSISGASGDTVDFKLVVEAENDAGEIVQTFNFDTISNQTGLMTQEAAIVPMGQTVWGSRYNLKAIIYSPSGTGETVPPVFHLKGVKPYQTYRLTRD